MINASTHDVMIYQLQYPYLTAYDIAFFLLKGKFLIIFSYIVEFTILLM